MCKGYDAIIFPDSGEDEENIPSSSSSNFSICTKESIYCENIDIYPRHYVKNNARDFEGYRSYFGIENDLVGRFSGSNRKLCDSYTRVIFPQAGINQNNEWRFIVNQIEDGYMQGIKIEECARYE